MENDENNRPIFNITSNNQQGGITAGQINIGQTPRQLTDSDKIKFNEIFDKYIKDKSKQINVIAIIGNSESDYLMRQIEAYMKSEGYNPMWVKSVRSDDPVGIIFETNPVSGELENIIIGRQP
ncbi:MAG: hypothetical protein WD512_20545 [Candidatus Paceibacterota bacterium]